MIIILTCLVPFKMKVPTLCIERMLGDLQGLLFSICFYHLWWERGVYVVQAVWM